MGGDTPRTGEIIEAAGARRSCSRSAESGEYSEGCETVIRFALLYPTPACDRRHRPAPEATRDRPPHEQTYNAVRELGSEAHLTRVILRWRRGRQTRSCPSSRRIDRERVSATQVTVWSAYSGSSRSRTTRHAVRHLGLRCARDEQVDPPGPPARQGRGLSGGQRVISRTTTRPGRSIKAHRPRTTHVS